MNPNQEGPADAHFAGAWVGDSRLSLRLDPAIVHEIERDRDVKFLIQARVLLSLGPLIFISFWGLDRIVAPDLAASFLWLRVPVLMLCLVSLPLCFVDRFAPAIRAISIAGICCGSFAISAICAVTDGFEASYLTGIVLMQIVPLFLPFRPSTVLGIEATIATGYVVINLMVHEAGLVMLPPIVFLCAASVLVVAVAFLAEQMRIRDGILRYQLAQANEELEQLAGLDPLTSLANRRTFDASLSREWRRTMRAGRPLCVILCDIDQFKQYNDRYGHPAGDTCLRDVAGTIQSSLLRASDLAARYGGEEFALLLPEIDVEGGLAVAERIRQAVESRALAHETSDHGVVTLSLGAAAFVPGPSHTPAALLERADRALYAAKMRGRNRVEPAHPAAKRRLSLVRP